MPYLESHQIGRLSASDQAAVEQENAEEVHAKSIAKGKEIAKERGVRLLGVMGLMPLLFFFRKLWRVIGILMPGFVHSISNKARAPIPPTQEASHRVETSAMQCSVCCSPQCS
jgi:hypothetical protein